jgi:hypothetical protein
MVRYHLRLARRCAYVAWRELLAAGAALLRLPGYDDLDEHAAMTRALVAFDLSPVRVTTEPGPGVAVAPWRPKVPGFGCPHMYISATPGVLRDVSASCGCSVDPTDYTS